MYVTRKTEADIAHILSQLFVRAEEQQYKLTTDVVKEKIQEVLIQKIDKEMYDTLRDLTPPQLIIAMDLLSQQETQAKTNGVDQPKAKKKKRTRKTKKKKPDTDLH